MKKPLFRVASSESRFAVRPDEVSHIKQSIKLEELKERLPFYLERYHSELIQKRTAHSLSLHCPFHEDRTPSCIVDDRKGVWLFNCFSCGRAGSLIDLHAEKTGLNPCSFEAIESVAQLLGVQLERSLRPSQAVRRAWTEQNRIDYTQSKKRQRELLEQEVLTRYQRENLYEKLRPYLSKDWRADLWYSSPVWADTPALATFAFIDVLFPPEAIIWMGECHETGKEKHRENFKTCREWIRQCSLPSRVAAGHFQAGSISRSKDNVITSPFIVIESDDLIGKKPVTDEEKRRNKVLSHALAGYCQKELGLHLRAVIDTGNKSLHLWFDRPSQDALTAVRTLAPGLRIDLGLLDSCSSAPLRMPCCIHEKTKVPATLLYLDHSAS